MESTLFNRLCYSICPGIYNVKINSEKDYENFFKVVTFQSENEALKGKGGFRSYQLLLNNLPNWINIALTLSSEELNSWNSLSKYFPFSDKDAIKKINKKQLGDLLTKFIKHQVNLLRPAQDLTANTSEVAAISFEKDASSDEEIPLAIRRHSSSANPSATHMEIPATHMEIPATHMEVSAIHRETLADRMEISATHMEIIDLTEEDPAPKRSKSINATSSAQQIATNETLVAYRHGDDSTATNADVFSFEQWERGAYKQAEQNLIGSRPLGFSNLSLPFGFFEAPQQTVSSQRAELHSSSTMNVASLRNSTSSSAAASQSSLQNSNSLWFRQPTPAIPNSMELEALSKELQARKILTKRTKEK